ncbi:NAD-dependent epimerase/dehydratase family protein [Clostridium sp. AF23-6LB]|uniref:NAD-dependent epimerase/dehydratase family protein n=1 Tax=Clostridium sp. AF23-6LB TaxID=2293005 RepID=UPI000E53BEA1|nr:NAD-dependent epimerase/dehydratase family protein [Clostridium sp. AF23-6LB]RGG37845.1 NAD-dependent epimerase/dehydratase family protein [Clostridium sp. AF23-6LB]
MKKILITGGTTFVSKYAAKYFVEHGYDVYVVNRNSKPQVKGVTLIESDRHNLGDKLKNLHFDVVADITAYDAQDIIDLHNSLDSFDQYIMISSSAVYPEYGVQPFHEDSERAVNKFWGKYGTDKIEAENALLERVPDGYILRPPYLYGSMDNVYREAFVFDCAMADRKFYLPEAGEMKLQFFHVEDLCRLMEVLITKRPTDHILNVGNENVISISDWVIKCYACFDKVPEFVSVPETVEQRNYFSFYNYEYCLDVTRQKKIYPETMSMDAGLQEAANWYIEHEGEVNKKPYWKYIDANLV